jgi:hypothetical protein
MKARVLLQLLVAAAVALALAPAAGSSSGDKVKLYYGTIGSNDFVWGTAGPQAPTDAWQQHSLMPQALMDLCCASNGTNVYVVSGYNASSPRFLLSHPVGGTTWTTLAPPPIEVSNGGCAVIGDTLFYCSGYSTPAAATIDTLQKYCISTNTWTTGPGPFTGTTYNWQPFVLALGGKVYYISGCNQPGATDPTREVYAYTPGAGWARVADMNTGSVFASGWVYGGKIWIAGGIVGSAGITRTEFYDPGADTWIVNNTVFPQMPYGTWGAGSGIVGNTGFVASGVDAASALTDSVMHFDHTTNTWSVSEPIFLRIYRTCGYGNPDGKAVLYGGSTGGFAPSDVCQYEDLPTGSQLRVLWIYSDFGAPDTTLGVRLRALGDSVEYFDAQTGTPTIGQLMAYDAVGAHSNYPYSDPTALGNVLAAYVDSGRGVVLGSASFATGWAMGGTIMTGSYATIGVGSVDLTPTTMGWYNSGHPVMVGVTSVAEKFASTSAFAASAESVARWTDGRPYVAVSANRKVVGVNQFPSIYAYPERQGDWALVIHNALGFVASGGAGVKEFNPLAPAMNVTLSATPNPTRFQARISFAAPNAASVNVAFYDLNGRLVRTLVTGGPRTGINQVIWNLEDNNGRAVAGGVYFCKLVADGRTVSRKLVVH